MTTAFFLAFSVSSDFREIINTPKAHHTLAIVSKISFLILPSVTIFEYFCRYLYIVGIYDSTIGQGYITNDK